MLLSDMLLPPLRTLVLSLSCIASTSHLAAEPFVHTIRIEPTDITIEPSSSDRNLTVQVRGIYRVPFIDPRQFTLSAVSAKMHWGAGSHAWCTNRPNETLLANSTVSLGFNNGILKYLLESTEFAASARDHTQSVPFHWQSVTLPAISNFRTPISPTGPGFGLTFNLRSSIGGDLSFGPHPYHPTEFAFIKLGQLEFSYTLEPVPGGWEKPPVWWDPIDTPRVLSRVNNHYRIVGVPFPSHLYATFDLPSGLATAPRLTALPNGKIQVDFLGVLQTSTNMSGWWPNVSPEPLSPYIITPDLWKPKLFFRSMFD
jgi:hypothetical protein